MSEKPLVSVCCITYNHGPFIRQCLDGILMQTTNFSFEVLIHDDASTDETQAIIKEYQRKFPGIVKPMIQKENQYSKGLRGINIHFNFPRAQGKYIALCEGDDYWTDALKLQKQVDVLKADENLSLCCHAWQVVSETGHIISSYEPESFISSTTNQCSFGLDEFIKNWITKTLSIMFPLAAVDFQDIQKYQRPVDKHLYYTLLKTGRGVFLNELMGAYRIHRGGVVSLISKVKKEETIRAIARDIYQNNVNEPYARKMYLRSLQKQIMENVQDSGYFKSLIKNRNLFNEIARVKKNLKDYKHIVIPYLPRYIVRIGKRL